MSGTALGEIVIKRQLEAVAEVRAFIRLTLDYAGVEDNYIPCLVASELVTNAIRYACTAEDDITLRLGCLDDGALWLEVQDSTCEIPRIVDVALTSESGRGLFVVEQFTRYWGVRPLPTRPARWSSPSSTRETEQPGRVHQCTVDTSSVAGALHFVRTWKQFGVQGAEPSCRGAWVAGPPPG